MKAIRRGALAFTVGLVMAFGTLVVGSSSAQAANPCYSESIVYQSNNDVRLRDAQGCDYARQQGRYHDYYGTYFYTYHYSITPLPGNNYNWAVSITDPNYTADAVRACTGIPYVPCTTSTYSIWRGWTTWNTF